MSTQDEAIVDAFYETVDIQNDEHFAEEANRKVDGNNICDEYSEDIDEVEYTNFYEDDLQDEKYDNEYKDEGIHEVEPYNLRKDILDDGKYDDECNQERKEEESCLPEDDLQDEKYNEYKDEGIHEVEPYNLRKDILDDGKYDDECNQERKEEDSFLSEDDLQVEKYDNEYKDEGIHEVEPYNLRKDILDDGKYDDECNQERKEEESCLSEDELQDEKYNDDYTDEEFDEVEPNNIREDNLQDEDVLNDEEIQDPDVTHIYNQGYDYVREYNDEETAAEQYYVDDANLEDASDVSVQYFVSTTEGPFHNPLSEYPKDNIVIQHNIAEKQPKHQCHENIESCKNFNITDDIVLTRGMKDITVVGRLVKRFEVLRDELQLPVLDSIVIEKYILDPVNIACSNIAEYFTRRSQEANSIQERMNANHEDSRGNMNYLSPQQLTYELNLAVGPAPKPALSRLKCVGKLVKCLNIFYNHRQRTLDVLEVISKRERVLSNIMDISDEEKRGDVPARQVDILLHKELNILQRLSLEVVERIQLWRKTLCVDHPFVVINTGENYIIKMMTDCKDLGSSPSIKESLPQQEILIKYPLLSNILSITRYAIQRESSEGHYTPLGAPPMDESYRARLIAAELYMHNEIDGQMKILYLLMQISQRGEFLPVVNISRVCPVLRSQELEYIRRLRSRTTVKYVPNSTGGGGGYKLKRIMAFDDVKELEKKNLTLKEGATSPTASIKVTPSPIDTVRPKTPPVPARYSLRLFDDEVRKLRIKGRVIPKRGDAFAFQKGIRVGSAEMQELYNTNLLKYLKVLQQPSFRAEYDEWKTKEEQEYWNSVKYRPIRHYRPVPEANTTLAFELLNISKNSCNEKTAFRSISKFRKSYVAKYPRKPLYKIVECNAKGCPSASARDNMADQPPPSL